MEKPIVLTGMMGSGKSALGRALARKLDIPFVDADAEIIAQAGKSIPEIFAQNGETEFRRVEAGVLARLIQGQPAVIAAGGGAVLDPQTRALLKARARTIWLQADVDTLFARAGADPNRPLLKDKTPREKLAKLLEARTVFYAEADFTLRTDEGDFAATLERLAALATGSCQSSVKTNLNDLYCLGIDHEDAI